jgi:hypothetical protein
MRTSNFLLLFFLLFSIQTLHAHAVVTHSTLNVKSISPQQYTQIELTFNSRIELKLSQIFLVSAGDSKQKVESLAGQKPGHLLINIPPLKTGKYALQLKVFAADGHLSEDLIRFIVTE